MCFVISWSNGCLWYCKSTIFKANHNRTPDIVRYFTDVCDTAKVRFFKQITTRQWTPTSHTMMFVILQKYDFSSKSQPACKELGLPIWCLWYCKSTIFQANHNKADREEILENDVCDTAKVRFFKQITTAGCRADRILVMFVILQKYDFSSKSQHLGSRNPIIGRCLWYCKSTIFQANHNDVYLFCCACYDVCDTAKVRFFKQITTDGKVTSAIMGCLWYCKSTIFQANHNRIYALPRLTSDVCDTAKVRFFKQITTCYSMCLGIILMFVILQKYDFSSKSQQGTSSMSYMARCLWYCKSTIFQANHNIIEYQQFCLTDVCDTAKVRFFKQITTPPL